MDYESTDSHPSPWYGVSFSSNRHSCRLKWLPEARADQKFVAVNQLPTSRQIPSAPRFDEEKQDKTTNVEPDASARPEGTLSPWTPGPDECGETESNLELRVRIERSIVLDNGSRDTDSEEQDFDSSPSGSQKSVWEEYDV